MVTLISTEEIYSYYWVFFRAEVGRVKIDVNLTAYYNRFFNPAFCARSGPF